MRPINMCSAAVALAAVCAGVGCGGDESSTAASKKDKTAAATKPAATPPAAKAPGAVQLTLGDFTISPVSSAAAAGTVKISAANGGNVEHEVLVLRSDAGPAGLKVQGQRVSEDGFQKGAFAGELEAIKPGASESKAFTLKAGTYTLFCNLPGHYKAGMHATLVVE